MLGLLVTARGKTAGKELVRKNIIAATSMCVQHSVSHALKTMEHPYTKIGTGCCQRECQLGYLMHKYQLNKPHSSFNLPSQV
jgi:hypothetical protein